MRFLRCVPGRPSVTETSLSLLLGGESNTVERVNELVELGERFLEKFFGGFILSFSCSKKAKGFDLIEAFGKKEGLCGLLFILWFHCLRAIVITAGGFVGRAAAESCELFFRAWYFDCFLPLCFAFPPCRSLELQKESKILE